ncbi:MAG: hypothetical protein ABSF03_32945 [Streptosporangiaceae bacterium]
MRWMPWAPPRWPWASGFAVPHTSPWERVAVLTRGQLLAPSPAG